MKCWKNGKRQIIISTHQCHKTGEKEKSHSFQNKADTYLKIMRQAAGDVSGSGVLEEISRSNIQYYETDWEFVKHMVSRLGLV